MKTEAEVIDFLESVVGTEVNTQPSSNLNGQCVTLIKAILAFLGAPNPWAARGNAKDYGDALIAQGIGTSGKGKLTIAVSRTMGVVGGVTYGHIWVIVGGNNYEQNGARALRVTKNTRPISQAQQFINLDKWITGGDNMALMTKDDGRILYYYVLGRNGERVEENALDGDSDAEINKYYTGKVELDSKALADFHNSPEAAQLRQWIVKAGQPNIPTDIEEVGNNTGLFQRKKK